MDGNNLNPNRRSNKIQFSLDPRALILVLLVIIAGMLIAWKPWAGAAQKEDRTITVTGESKITKEPDEYVFYPSYQFKDPNKEAALASLTKKSEEITGKLKSLGVENSKIKTNSDGYNYGYYFDNVNKSSTYNLQLAVTVSNKEQAQKVQDYLITTEPIGQISPQANFSDSKRKELENKARDEAVKDARAKAEQSARNLGFKVGKVKSITDGSESKDIMPMSRGAVDLPMAQDSAQRPSLGINPGENDLNYSVKVVYYVN